MKEKWPITISCSANDKAFEFHVKVRGRPHLVLEQQCQKPFQTNDTLTPGQWTEEVSYSP